MWKILQFLILYNQPQKKKNRKKQISMYQNAEMKKKTDYFPWQKNDLTTYKDTLEGFQERPTETTSCNLIAKPNK